MPVQTATEGARVKIRLRRYEQMLLLFLGALALLACGSVLWVALSPEPLHVSGWSVAGPRAQNSIEMRMFRHHVGMLDSFRREPNEYRKGLANFRRKMARAETGNNPRGKAERRRILREGEHGFLRALAASEQRVRDLHGRMRWS